MIERLSKVMAAALVGNSFLPFSSKFSLHMKKKVTRQDPKFTKH